MIQTMGFKDIKDMGKYEQGPSELPIIDKIPKGLWMRCTPKYTIFLKWRATFYLYPTNK
jgi:hypothetical protein